MSGKQKAELAVFVLYILGSLFFLGGSVLALWLRVREVKP